jgi:methionyl-tRNA formyltransferase
VTTGKLKVVFMGSPEFAVPSLQALAAAPSVELLCVASQPDSAKGRGRTVSPTPVRAAARELGLPTMVMTKGNYEASVGKISDLALDLIVVVAFGLILKEDLLELPPLGCVNLHASLLPKYRGVSPIQAAILAGDEETGCTTIQMDQGIDTGDILLSAKVPIHLDDTAASLAIELAKVGGDLLVRTVEGLGEGSIQPRGQDPDAGTYTKKIRKQHGLIDWSRPSDYLERFARAMSPWPSAYTFAGTKRLIILEAAALPAVEGREEPGTVLSLQPFRVACGGGALEIRRLKPEGKQQLTAEAFAAGTSLRAGDVLGIIR